LCDVSQGRKLSQRKEEEEGRKERESEAPGVHLQLLLLVLPTSTTTYYYYYYSYPFGLLFSYLLSYFNECRGIKPCSVGRGTVDRRGGNLCHYDDDEYNE